MDKITRRDFFAAAALVGIMASTAQETDGLMKFPDPDDPRWSQALMNLNAGRAFEWADAMIEEVERTE